MGFMIVKPGNFRDFGLVFLPFLSEGTLDDVPLGREEWADSEESSSVEGRALSRL